MSERATPSRKKCQDNTHFHSAGACTEHSHKQETTWIRSPQSERCQRTSCWWASHPSRTVWQTTCQCERSCDSWGSAPASCGWLWTAACDIRRKGRSPIARHPRLERKRREREAQKGEWKALRVFVPFLHTRNNYPRPTMSALAAQKLHLLPQLVEARNKAALHLFRWYVP